MNHKECACHPAVEKARYRAYLETGCGGGVYSSGESYDEAIASVKAHALKDGWPKKSWGEVWLIALDDHCDECGRKHPSCDVNDETKQILCFACRGRSLPESSGRIAEKAGHIVLNNLDHFNEKMRGVPMSELRKKVLDKYDRRRDWTNSPKRLAARAYALCDLHVTDEINDAFGVGLRKPRPLKGG